MTWRPAGLKSGTQRDSYPGADAHAHGDVAESNPDGCTHPDSDGY